MAALWFDDGTDPPVWHVSVERLTQGWYRMACDVEIRIRDGRRVWPSKQLETGPPREQRCFVCAEASP